MDCLQKAIRVAPDHPPVARPKKSVVPPAASEASPSQIASAESTVDEAGTFQWWVLHQECLLKVIWCNNLEFQPSDEIHPKV